MTPAQSLAYAYRLKRILTGDENSEIKTPYGKLAMVVKAELKKNPPRSTVLVPACWLLKECFGFDEVEQIIRDVIPEEVLFAGGPTYHGIDVLSLEPTVITGAAKRIGGTTRLGIWGEDVVLVQDVVDEKERIVATWNFPGSMFAS